MSRKHSQQTTEGTEGAHEPTEVTDAEGNTATVDGEPESEGESKSGKTPTTIGDLDATLREYATLAVAIVKSADQSITAFSEQIAMWCAKGLPDVLSHLRADKPEQVARKMTSAIVNTARQNGESAIKADSVKTGCSTAITIAFSKSHLVQHILSTWVSEKYKAPVSVSLTDSGEVIFWKDAEGKVRRHLPDPKQSQADGNEVSEAELNEANATFVDRTYALRSTYDLRYVAPADPSTVWDKLLTAIAAAVKAGTGNMSVVKASEYLQALEGLAPVLRTIALPNAEPDVDVHATLMAQQREAEAKVARKQAKRAKRDAERARLVELEERLTVGADAK